MRRLCALLLVGFVAMACGGDDECTVPEGVYPDWIKVIGCANDYALLWDERADAVFARTRTINWIIDREDDDQVYFIDTKKWTLHYFFAASFLDRGDLTPVGTHADFNLLNYRRDNRRFILGKLISYVDQELLTLELAAGDTAGSAMIIAAFDRVSAEIYNGDELKYRPVSASQEALLGDLEGEIPLIRTEDVFRGQLFQSLNEGVGYGTLRFARVAELAGEPLLPTELVVLDRVPNDISMVSGIITQEFQTPLSHINILSKNRGTPNMAVRDGFEAADLRAFEGELVRLEVTAQDYAISSATASEAQAYWDALRPSAPLVPDFDLAPTGFADLDDIGAGAAISVGAKAANMGEMTSVVTAEGAPLPLPEQPFAIPFSAYDRHLTEHGVWSKIDDFLADAAELEPERLRERLFAIRWLIYRMPMDPDLRDLLVGEVIARWGGERRVRLRSSTNVEDLPEFSGAGLYTSAGASASEGAQAIEDAVKVVWASAWNYQAFVERDFYRVDHRRVYMGVLVHPAFVGEEANGVAVTINEFTPLRPAYYINSQLGEVSVTNPTGQATPEQILYYTWYEEPEYEVITRSSLLEGVSDWPAGPSILTDDELNELASYLEAIHVHFNQLAGGGNTAMDVEYKLAPGRALVIKQARPLNLGPTKARAWPHKLPGSSLAPQTPGLELALQPPSSNSARCLHATVRSGEATWMEGLARPPRRR